MVDITPARTVFSLSAAFKAGLIAGLVFLILEMLLVGTVGGDSPWAPPRMIAAIGMGREVLPPPATFDITIILVAMVIHFVLSIVFALTFARIATGLRLSRTALLIAGAVFGLVLYFINFYGFTAIFPWFAMARNWISTLAHLVFGLVVAWAYLSNLAGNARENGA